MRTTVPVGSFLACAFSPRRALQVRGHRLTLPSFRIAALQLAMAGANWLAIAGVIYTLLFQRIDFPSVLCALLAAAAAIVYFVFEARLKGGRAPPTGK